MRVKFTDSIYSEDPMMTVMNTQVGSLWMDVGFSKKDRILYIDKLYEDDVRGQFTLNDTVQTKENNIGDMVYTPQGQGIIIPIGENVNREDYTGETQSISKSLSDNGKVYELIKREVKDDTERSELIERRRRSEETDLRRQIQRESKDLKRQIESISGSEKSFG